MAHIERNAPCPCGSGKKYKKCCGSVVPIAAMPLQKSSQGRRQCGDCTACCDGWLRARILGQEIKPGTPCRFSKAGGGCSIYEERPQNPCREFVCGWLTPDNPFPESFKPSVSGVIIYPTKWRGRRAYQLVSAGRDPSPAILDWMMRFSQQTGTPFFYEENGETVAYGPRIFQEDVLQLLRSGKSLWKWFITVCSMALSLPLCMEAAA